MNHVTVTLTQAQSAMARIALMLLRARTMQARSRLVKLAAKGETDPEMEQAGVTLEGCDSTLAQLDAILEVFEQADPR